MAQSMVDEGLVGAGYNSIIFDDCYTKKNRSDAGKLLEGMHNIEASHSLYITNFMTQISKDSPLACEA